MHFSQKRLFGLFAAGRANSPQFPCDGIGSPASGRRCIREVSCPPTFEG